MDQKKLLEEWRIPSQLNIQINKFSLWKLKDTYYVPFVEEEEIMKSEFTAIIEEAPEGGYWAICPEIPGANGQGESIEEAKESLRGAIELILEDRREDIFRGLPEDVIRDKIMVAWNGETLSESFE